MRIVGEENVFLRNIITTIIKGTSMDMGTIYNGTLYLLVNHGILYTVDISKFFPSYMSCTFKLEDIKITDEYIEDHMDLQQSFLQRINQVIMIENISNPIYHNINCREDENFENIVSCKASDGASKYYIDTSCGRTFMYLYKPMFGLAKNDKCELKVYQYDINKFLSIFTIYKTKLKISYKMYFLFMNMMGE